MQRMAVERNEHSSPIEFFSVLGVHITCPVNAQGDYGVIWSQHDQSRD